MRNPFRSEVDAFHFLLLTVVAFAAIALASLLGHAGGEGQGLCDLVSDRNRGDHELPPSTESAIRPTKFAVASKGAAWLAPSLSWVVAVGMAAARPRTRATMFFA